MELERDVLSLSSVLESYLNKKGLTQSVLDSFQAAYKSQGTFYWRRFPEQLREKVTQYATTMNAITLPIYNVYSELCGFVLRQFESDCKYLCIASQKELFGLNLTAKYVVENDLAYLVEGPFDFIKLFTEGFQPVVSMLGNFLSLNSLLVLLRFTNNFVFIFDPDVDESKIRRSLIKLKRWGVSVKYTVLKEDPDEFVTKFGLKSFLENVSPSNLKFL